MSTVTFKIDDAIYKKATELLEQQGLGSIELYLKTILETVVVMAARGEIQGTITTEKLENGLDKVRQKVKRIKENQEEDDHGGN